MKPIAKKHFGQHFLSNTGVVAKIKSLVEALLENPKAAVLEIGPGQGALTSALLTLNRPLLAYEVDRDMIEQLQVRFDKELKSGQLKIIHGDFLEATPEELSQHLGTLPIVATGNLPYNVGSQIVFHLLEDFENVHALCVMLQKEVVQKFTADQTQRSQYGPPAIKVAWLAERGDHFWVSPGSFQPPPKVQSGVFTLRKKAHPHPFEHPLSKDSFYTYASELIHKAFSQRRKMLRNTLGPGLQEKYQDLRPDEVSPQTYLDIAKSLKDR